MRIIGGTARGRRLFSPASGTSDIRPTSDRAREAIFNILAGRVGSARVLDLFAGTGALGLEALSRGAVSAVFVDKSHSSLGLIGKNIQQCHFAEKSLVLKKDLGRSLAFLQSYVPEGGFSLVFIDPPYIMQSVEAVITSLAHEEIIAVGGLVVAELSAASHLPAEILQFSLVDRRSYGEAGFWFYEKKTG